MRKPVKTELPFTREVGPKENISPHFNFSFSIPAMYYAKSNVANHAEVP